MLTSPRTSPRSTPTTRPASTVPTCWLTSICAAPSWDASRASGSGAATIAAPHWGQKCIPSDMLWLHLGQFMLCSVLLYYVALCATVEDRCGGSSLPSRLRHDRCPGLQWSCPPSSPRPQDQ